MEQNKALAIRYRLARRRAVAGRLVEIGLKAKK
jgi:hypothetical protein